MIFIPDVRLKKPAMGRGCQKFLIDRLGDILRLVNGTDNKLHLKHVAFVLVPDLIFPRKSGHNEELVTA